MTDLDDIAILAQVLPRHGKRAIIKDGRVVEIVRVNKAKKETVRMPCDRTIRVSYGGKTLSAEVFKSRGTGKFIYWCPFSGARVVLDINKLTRGTYPPPPSGNVPYPDTWPKGAKPALIEDQHNIKRRALLYGEMLRAHRKEHPSELCVVALLGKVQGVNPVWFNHHVRGRN